MTAGGLDRVALTRLRTDLGSEASVRDILASFLDEGPGLLAQVQEAVRRADARGLDHAAHTLKSMSATIGALALADACRDLELLGKAGDLGGAPALAARAEAEFARAAAALRAELGPGPG